MSADSPRRGVHKGAQIVSPQAVSDRSIIDSVAGIINDIVPQAYTGGGGSGGSGSGGTSNADNKESITWARFEYADVNDPALYPDHNEGSSTPPLLLVLGYTTGVQVWLIAASGEATEVLSWRQGVVRTLRILPNPKLEDEYQSNNSTLDPFETKRPLVAICDSAGPGPQFCSVSFVSLKTGEQAKNIKFKNSVCDVLANRRSVVVTFHERIAVFDAKTLEDVLTVTTCYPSPGPNPNPVALGRRWLAYSEKKLLPTRRSSGGSEGEGVQSYTATVLYAAKSLGKGLRGLGETVASSLTGNSVTPLASSNNVGNDSIQPGVVTILDLRAAKEEKDLDDSANIETVIAHFTAHNDAIVAMCFDLTGALLLTADKRGHDFHVFRIQPHPGGPTLAAVHHLYVLHRGDTTAKVQDMTFSSDTRWAAVSTVRGTTHVFPVAPYGGPVGVRTHSTPHVVNRLSRFHRSAGLTDDGTRSHSPVSHAELPLSVYPYTNPRLPPYPHPTILHPLAQIRQPSTLNHINNQSQPRTQQRQRLHSEDSGALPLKICACFAPPRAWIYTQRDSTSKVTKRAVDSLFIMACHGNMIQYDLEPKPVAGIPKEKVCDDTMIELEVEAKGQWPLLRSPSSLEISPPLSSSSPLLLSLSSIPKNSRHVDSAEDRWLSQVEIVTHAGPHRRLWMGPQFVFKTYNAPSGVAVNLVEAEAIEIGVTGGATSRPARSNPVNMPHAASRPLVPVVIDGSGSSYEQSPRFMEAYGDPMENDNMPIGSGENQLREDLAEAMLETSTAPHRVPGRRMVFERVGQPVTKVVNPLGTVITVSADEEDASSQETDNNDDESTNNSLEPPKSICAEEGPASLGDFEPINEGQSLSKCNLTEICAEMRKTTEPIIDNVPDENIKEVKERKTLCARVAKMSGTRTSIDFEKEEAFKDVPTGLNICAQPGEIPDSPMTHAKETLWLKHQEEEEKKKTDIAKNIAKYVVNYDEESLVLLENVEMRKKKYLIKEEQDSVVVEDKTNPKPKLEPKKKTRKPTPPRKSSSSERRNVEEELDEDDIEHIHSSELKLNLKLSDDIEHIQISELTEPAKPPKSGVRRHSKNVLSSDDDLEHVLHSEIRELENNAKLKSARKKKSVSEGVGKTKIDDNIDDEDDDDEPIEIISIDSSQKTAEVECKIVDVRSSEVSSTMRSKKSHQKSRKIVAREPAGDEPPSSAVSRSSSSSSWSSIVKRRNTATDKPPKQLPAEKEVPVPASSSLQAKFKDSNEGDKILDESSIPETQEPSMIPVPVEDVPKVPEDVKVEKKDEQQEEEEVEVVVPPDTLETADKSDDSAVDKRSDSELESGVAPERSSSSDEVNANVVPMDTEEDSAERLREGADKSNVTPSNSCNWSNAAKKGNRSRKKKRR